MALLTDRDPPVVEVDEQFLCVVCLMPAPGIEYAIRYEAGEEPPIQDVRLYLCRPHASALSVSAQRPVRVVGSNR